MKNCKIPYKEKLRHFNYSDNQDNHIEEVIQNHIDKQIREFKDGGDTE